MFAPRIRLDPGLLERAKQRALELKYDSVDDYIRHLIEQDLDRLSPGEDAAVQERLRGLGYL